MSECLGLDVGTTTVKAVVIESETGAVVRRATAPNDSEMTSSEDKRAGRSEWDPDRILAVAQQVLSEVGSDTVRAVGVTGQMHGMLLVDGCGRPIGPFIGWQDQRGAEPKPDSNRTLVADLIERLDTSDPARHVCRPKTGYMGATLSWLLAYAQVPAGSRACFLPDFVSSRLTDTLPVSDPTNAAGSGLYDVAAGQFHPPFAELSESSLLPDVVPSGFRAGELKTSWPDSGLRSGIPVGVASGDNQASFLGSVREPVKTVLINVGTGGQMSVSATTPDAGPGLEARPHVNGAYILVGPGLVGGRTYAWLRDFFLEVGRKVFGVEEDPEAVYDRMTELADLIESGAEGLTAEPLLTGTREDPHRRGRLDGIGTANFTSGHLSRAVLEGIAEQFRILYESALKVGAGRRSILVGAGNGVRKNPVLREIVEQQFEMEMRIPIHTEEAAYGAAMQAMVLCGAKKSLKEAAEIIRYE
ncbi:hypothetical protein MK139_04390 [bacterium]|nr:hypothetical protein [bacterium]